MPNSEDPDEMPHVAAFQQGLRSLLINLKRKKFIIFISYNRSPLNIHSVAIGEFPNLQTLFQLQKIKYI